MRRALLLVTVLTLVAPSYGAPPSTVKQVATVARAATRAKPVSLAAMTLRNSGSATDKLDNVDEMLDLATAESRIDDVAKIQLRSSYSNAENGDVLLLTCLRNKACQPEQFLETAKISAMHAEVMLRNPRLTTGQVNQQVGAITERLMNRFFEDSGWERINGQVGQTGIDGLFIKRRDGVVRDVLVAESKYNTSSLGETKFGTQMSKDWIRRKLEELEAAYPGDTVYRDIDRFIEEDVYRALVWNLRVNDKTIDVALSTVKSKGSEVRLVKVYGKDIEELAKPVEQQIQLKAPANNFQKQFVQNYLEELDAIGASPF